MFMDQKNQYSENEYTTQSNLQIQCNPYQATSHMSLLELRFSPEGNGTPLQYSCLEYPMDGGAW